MYTIKRVISKEQRKKAKNFVNQYHSYIKWADRPSRKLYWILYEKNKMVGVFGLSSAFTRPKPIMSYIEKHSIEFNEVGNNIVYCLYGHSHNYAGSKLLSLIRKDAVYWWNERYRDKLKAFQTFILPPRNGTVYKADNWEYLGKTSGGKVIRTRTLYNSERDKYPSNKIEVRKFNNGEVKYLLREYIETEAKLIYMKLTSKKQLKKLYIKKEQDNNDIEYMLFE